MLDDGDRHLLDLLARDGRAAPGELAAATGLSPSTVRRRITELATHPGVAVAAAVTGDTNLYASIDVATAQVFYHYLTASGVRLARSAPRGDRTHPPHPERPRPLPPGWGMNLSPEP
ncbi:AsnC family protein [[Actinomadura] parvosata]|uniref:AsnC family protein n=1 Tax=[Actinomadura] parvosata TaxID=1955412 RepID=UPI001E567C34|nr:Lrp/AsnC family transcriptional regulator [Nonomuraea sp. ATCC 55076]